MFHSETAEVLRESPAKAGIQEGIPLVLVCRPPNSRHTQSIYTYLFFFFFFYLFVFIYYTCVCI